RRRVAYMPNSEIIAAALLELEPQVAGRPTPVPDRIRTDRWIASSALQKAIRRGDVNFALRAAYTCLAMDAASFWRGLPIIASEDIGLCDQEVTVPVILAAHH